MEVSGDAGDQGLSRDFRSPLPHKPCLHSHPLFDCTSPGILHFAERAATLHSQHEVGDLVEVPLRGGKSRPARIIAAEDDSFTLSYDDGDIGPQGLKAEQLCREVATSRLRFAVGDTVEVRSRRTGRRHPAKIAAPGSAQFLVEYDVDGEKEEVDEYCIRFKPLRISSMAMHPVSEVTKLLHWSIRAYRLELAQHMAKVADLAITYLPT